MLSIYGIDPRGLTDLGDESIAMDTFRTALPDENFSQGQLTALGIGKSSLMNEVRSIRTACAPVGRDGRVRRGQPERA